MAILSNKGGFRYPITPSSATSLLDLATEPTHRIAGDMLTIAFEADPAVVREFVPEPIELDGSGLCYLRFFDTWVYTDRQLTEFVSPERVNFGEAFFWIPCVVDGELYHYMPFSWVNRDWLAYLGRTVGQPHKLAKVQMTRFHPADSVDYGPHEGVRLTFSVDCVGRVLQGTLDLEREFEREGGDLPISIVSRHRDISPGDTSGTRSTIARSSMTSSRTTATSARSVRSGVARRNSTSSTPRTRKRNGSHPAGSSAAGGTRCASTTKTVDRTSSIPLADHRPVPHGQQAQSRADPEAPCGWRTAVARQPPPTRAIAVSLARRDTDRPGPPPSSVVIRRRQPAIAATPARPTPRSRRRAAMPPLGRSLVCCSAPALTVSKRGGSECGTHEDLFAAHRQHSTGGGPFADPW